MKWYLIFGNYFFDVLQLLLKSKATTPTTVHDK